MVVAAAQRDRGWEAVVPGFMRGGQVFLYWIVGVGVQEITVCHICQYFSREVALDQVLEHAERRRERDGDVECWGGRIPSFEEEGDGCLREGREENVAYAPCQESCVSKRLLAACVLQWERRGAHGFETFRGRRHERIEGEEEE